MLEVYPPRSYGKSSRSFQSHWYAQFDWLEYSIEKDAVFCFPCRFFTLSQNADSAFISHGFRDWKHASGKSGALASHNICASHKDAQIAFKHYMATKASDITIQTQLDTQRQQLIQANRQYVSTIVGAILYCAQQGIALRGHRDVEPDAFHNQGNFRSLIDLLARHDEQLQNRISLGPRNATWMGHELQNELIVALGQRVLSCIAREVKEAGKFTIIADETKDVGKCEQLSIVLRYFHNKHVRERFIGFFYAKELNASSLSEYILEALRNINVSISDCVSQCYDGASVMSGRCNGVAAKLQEKNSKAIYVHCHAHRLNLVLVDTAKSVVLAANFFTLLEELYVFMSSSVPHTKFLANQARVMQLNRVIQLKQLSDTRWSCRHDSVKSVLTTFPAIITTLRQITDEDHDSIRRVKAEGLLLQICKFEFVLNLVMFQALLAVTANLSNLLQAEQLNFAAAATCIEAVLDSLHSFRSEQKWADIWSQAESLSTTNNISIGMPTRPRRVRRLPSRLTDSVVTEPTGSASAGTGGTSDSEHCKVTLYYPVLDSMIGEMKRRFDGDNILMLKAMQAFLPSSEVFLRIQTLAPFLLHYQIDTDGLENEVSVVRQFLREKIDKKEVTLMHHVYNELEVVPEAFPILLASFKHALTIGVSSATAERSFSALRRLKTYLRSTMGQDRLTNLALLYIERDISAQFWSPDAMEEIVKDFGHTHGNSRIALH